MIMIYKLIYLFCSIYSVSKYKNINLIPNNDYTFIGLYCLFCSEMINYNNFKKHLINYDNFKKQYINEIMLLIINEHLNDMKFYNEQLNLLEFD